MHSEPQYLQLDDIGVLAEFGVRSQEDPFSIIRQPLDAAFLGEHEVAVLDHLPPWVRVFDRNGVFRRAFMRPDVGAEASLRPSTMTVTGDGNLVLSGTSGVWVLDALGAPLAGITPMRNPLLRTVEACDGHLFAIVEPDSGVAGSARLARAGDVTIINPAAPETLLVFGRSLLSPWRHFSWFVSTDREGLLFYTEESHLPRLLDVSCNGTVRREILLDSLGPGDLYEDLGVDRRGRARFVIRHGPPPYPAGVVRVGNRVLWASQEVAYSSPEEVDSVTIITAYDSAAGTKKAAIDGWFQLLSSDSSGRLLVGNSFGYNRVWGLFPSVVMIDGQHLLQLLDGLRPQ